MSEVISSNGESLNTKRLVQAIHIPDGSLVVSAADFDLMSGWGEEIERLREELRKYMAWAESCDDSPETVAEIERLRARLDKFRGLPDHWIALDGMDGEPIDPDYIRRPAHETSDEARAIIAGLLDVTDPYIRVKAREYLERGPAEKTEPPRITFPDDMPMSERIGDPRIDGSSGKTSGGQP